MITFKQFISESEKPDSEIIADTILENCQPYLESPDFNTVFLRGLKIRSADPNKKFIDLHEKAFIGNVRKNRRPGDSSPVFHGLFNDLLKSQFGINARSETLFVVQDELLALEYGSVYRIFPIGNYEAIWSPSITDVYDIETLSPTPEFKKFILEAARQIFNVKDYTDSELSLALFKNKPKPEFSKNPFNLRDKKVLAAVLSQVFKNHGSELYVKNNLDKITNNKTEIMLVCDKYIAVKQRYVDSVIHQINSRVK